jgi:hypothetical protein
MELLRETAPLIGGLVVPPILLLLIRANWSDQRKFLATLLPPLVLGFCTSALAGELVAGMPNGLIAVIIDTSLVYTCSQLTYRLVWKPLLKAHLVRRTATKIAMHE